MSVLPWRLVCVTMETYPSCSAPRHGRAAAVAWTCVVVGADGDGTGPQLKQTHVSKSYNTNTPPQKTHSVNCYTSDLYMCALAGLS